MGTKSWQVEAAAQFSWRSWIASGSFLPSAKWNCAYLFVALVSFCLWPDVDQCQQFSAMWVAPIFLRNLVATVILYGGMHHWLYVSAKGKRKFNASYPPDAQHSRDRTWTLVSCLISASYEVGYIWLLANGYASHYRHFGQQLGWSLLWLALVPYWRTIHFHFAHRFLHPWRSAVSQGLDPGRWLYRNIHSHHHKSHNPGPWSGLSMHPAETTLYFSCVLLHTLFAQHPIHFLFTKMNADLSPINAHHGFEDPAWAPGSKFHFLHHKHFECNYGGMMLPIDVLCGTYRVD